MFNTDVREEHHHTSVARTSNKCVISSGDLYCCLLLQVRSFAHMPFELFDRNISNRQTGFMRNF